MSFIRASLIIILFFTAIAHAQGEQAGAKCSLTTEQFAQAAELKGLWPGMNLEQVRAVVPSLEMGKPDELGLSKTSFSPDFNPKINKAAFQGVRTVSLDFLDDKLFSVWVGYNETYKWKTIDEIVRAVTQSLKLPNSWEAKGRGQQLTCGSFQLAVTMVAGSPTLRITDETARETWEKRRAEREEEN
ncbi:MAG TPA: hypothetical protein VJS44_20280 [Pyrinomonadaceae bacterium]|nr:hypothetical protein [Pyrinomonadaceae bacterium]